VQADWLAETQSVTNTSEKSQQHPPEFEQLLHERHVGQFERSFTFPTKVESSGMRAQLENGLLKIMVPKSSGEPKVKRQISIE
jgi:HSP20 family protein